MISTTYRSAGWACAVAAAATLIAVASNSSRNAPKYALSRYAPKKKRRGLEEKQPLHIETSRRFNHSSALLAGSVLADSGMAQYRGTFSNPAMFIPPAIATCSLLAGLHGGADSLRRMHTVRNAIYWGATFTGILGTGFHLYNVLKRPGGWRWENLFHAAPIGAPTALLLSGALGATAEHLRDQPAHSPRLFGMPAGRALGLLSGMGLIDSALEAALLHFRGSSQHKAMYAPVTLPPAASLLLLHASCASPRPRGLARIVLQCTVWLGWIGAAFHAGGVARHRPLGARGSMGSGPRDRSHSRSLC